MGTHQIIQLGGAGTPGLNPGTPGVNTNPPSQVQLPVSVLVGTNNPNGIVTAAYGSIYNQFDGTGTNYVQSWIKQKSAGNTNWVAHYNPGNVTYANGQAIPNTLGLVYPDGHQAAAVANGADNLYANWAFISQGVVGPVGASNIVGSLPLSQVSGAGTVATLSSNSVLAMAAVQVSGIISTSPIPAASLTGSITVSNVTPGTLAGILNPSLATNPAVLLNDGLFSTNASQSAYAFGGLLAQAARGSNAVFLALGDSYAQGQHGFGSSIFDQLYFITAGCYGDCGFAGVGLNGFANYGTTYMRSLPTNMYPVTTAAQTFSVNVLYPADTNTLGNGCFQAFSGYAQINSHGGQPRTNATTVCGVLYNATPCGGQFYLSIYSPSTGYTNGWTVIDYTNTVIPGLAVTNVPAGYDYVVSIFPQAGTNIPISAVFLNTNNGVQYWNLGFAGTANGSVGGGAGLLSVGTNWWAHLFGILNPTVVLWNDVHSDALYSTWTNNAKALMGWNTNVPIGLVGIPSSQTGDTAGLNYWYKQTATVFPNWYYIPLYGYFPNTNNQTWLNQFTFNNSGTPTIDNLHVGNIGASSRGQVLSQLLGVAPDVNAPIYAQRLVGAIPTQVGLAGGLVANPYTGQFTAQSFAGDGSFLTNRPTPIPLSDLVYEGSGFTPTIQTSSAFNSNQVGMAYICMPANAASSWMALGFNVDSAQIGFHTNYVVKVTCCVTNKLPWPSVGNIAVKAQWCMKGTTNVDFTQLMQLPAAQQAFTNLAPWTLFEMNFPCAGPFGSATYGLFPGWTNCVGQLQFYANFGGSTTPSALYVTGITITGY